MHRHFKRTTASTSIVQAKLSAVPPHGSVVVDERVDIIWPAAKHARPNGLADLIGVRLLGGRQQPLGDDAVHHGDFAEARAIRLDQSAVFDDDAAARLDSDGHALL